MNRDGMHMDHVHCCAVSSYHATMVIGELDIQHPEVCATQIQGEELASLMPAHDTLNMYLSYTVEQREFVEPRSESESIADEEC